MSPRYRRGVVAVFVNEKNQVLVCERADEKGAWQFPQGGLEAGEDDEDAFYREVEEELGQSHCEILRISDSRPRYLWPEPGKKYDGQEQTWFLARFTGGRLPRLDKSEGCFRAWKWASPEDVVNGIIEWKRAATLEGLRLLGLLR